MGCPVMTPAWSGGDEGHHVGVADHDVGAVGGQPGGDRSADATRGTGDLRGFPEGSCGNPGGYRSELRSLSRMDIWRAS
jgi:hypothetical protein